MVIFIAGFLIMPQKPITFRVQSGNTKKDHNYWLYYCNYNTHTHKYKLFNRFFLIIKGEKKIFFKMK